MRDVLVCLLWNSFSSHEQKKKCEDVLLQSIANASIEHNLREIDALICARLLLPDDLDRLLCIQIHLNLGSEDQIVFGTLTPRTML